MYAVLKMECIKIFKMGLHRNNMTRQVFTYISIRKEIPGILKMQTLKLLLSNVVI